MIGIELDIEDRIAEDELEFLVPVAYPECGVELAGGGLDPEIDGHRVEVGLDLVDAHSQVFPSGLRVGVPRPAVLEPVRPVEPWIEEPVEGRAV